MLLLYDDDGEGILFKNRFRLKFHDVILILGRISGEAWISRSLFLVEGYTFLCIENAADFGKSE